MFEAASVDRVIGPDGPGRGAHEEHEHATAAADACRKWSTDCDDQRVDAEQTIGPDVGW